MSEKSPSGQNQCHDHHEHDHSHGHGHGGHFHHHGASTENIRLAFFLNFSFSVIELIGGLWIGSMAIVADAVHDFGDSLSLGTAWFLERYAKRGRDQRFNFGYRRFSLLSALIAGVVISCGSTLILYESIRRLGDPGEPHGLAMVGLALIGLLVNGAAAWRLSSGKTQNEKMLTWHLIEDVLGWAIVLIGGLVIHFTGLHWLDPVLAIGLSLYVLYNVVRHLKGTAYLFLQGRPLDFNESRFRKEAMAIAGVEHIDHLAVWSLDGESSILSARIHIHDLRDPLEIEKVKSKVKDVAREFGAQVATLETCMAESVPHGDEWQD